MDKRQKKVYQGIILVLLLLIIFLVWKLVTIKTDVDTIIIEKEQAMTQTSELQRELDELMAEHARIKEEYGLLTDKLTKQDSLILSQAQEIEMLINSQADYRRIKRQLDYLRSITQGYVHQIDSLYAINQQLVEENEIIKQDLLNEQQRTFELSQDKEDLEGKISSEAYLRAYAVNARAFSVRSNGKETETDKARRTEVIRVCFTLGENSLVPEGTKDIYIRIARPDNLILTQGSYSFIYQGDRIQFTEKTSVQYNKKSQSVCVSYRRGDVELLPGVYHVNVFADDRMIGECSFSLN